MARFGPITPWETETPGERLFLLLYEFVRGRAPDYANEHAWVISNEGMREFFRLVMTMELTHRCRNIAVELIAGTGKNASVQAILRELRSDIGLHANENTLRQIAEQSRLTGVEYIDRKLTDGQSNTAHRESPVQCCWCGTVTSRAKGTLKNEVATVEHVWPESLGGTSQQANLTIACAKCNSYRQHAFSWAWFGLQACNEQPDENGSLPRQLMLALALHRLMRVAAGHTPLVAKKVSLKVALRILKSAIPKLKLKKGRRYTFFELLELAMD